jgi:hypothetical protein
LTTIVSLVSQKGKKRERRRKEGKEKGRERRRKEGREKEERRRKEKSC